MKLADTDGVKSLKVIKLIDGVYMRSLPMSQMQEIIEGLADNDEDNQVKTINDFFDKIIVDEQGEPFEDLQDSCATDILPINTILRIITAFQEEITPSGKR